MLGGNVNKKTYSLLTDDVFVISLEMQKNTEFTHAEDRDAVVVDNCLKII